MNWFKQNWFKVSMVAIVFIIGAYSVIIINTRENKIRLYKCRDMGEEYRKNEIKENPNLSFFNPKYTYSKTLSSCIYSGGFMDVDIKEDNVTRYIKNLNTNEEIIGSAYIGKEKMFGVHNSEFFDKEQELFSK